jgi:ABC-type Na+ efflux pump permease subunit
MNKKFLIVILIFAISFIVAIAIINKEGGKEMEKPSIEDVISRYDDQLLSQEGVVGVGTGETSTGEPCIKVYVIEKTPELEEVIPKELEGYTVEIEEIGEVKAL